MALPHTVREVTYGSGAFSHPEYNDLPYDSKGWCCFEEGVAQVVAAYLAMLASVGQLAPEHAAAEAHRPKLISLCGDGVCEIHVPDQAPGVVGVSSRGVPLYNTVEAAPGSAEMTRGAPGAPESPDDAPPAPVGSASSSLDEPPIAVSAEGRPRETTRALSWHGEKTITFARPLIYVLLLLCKRFPVNTPLRLATRSTAITPRCQGCGSPCAAQCGSRACTRGHRHARCRAHRRRA